MPIRPPHDLPRKESEDSSTSGAFCQIKETILRLKKYLRGRSATYFSAAEAETLEIADWARAVEDPESSSRWRNHTTHKLVYTSPSEIEQRIPDRSATPFELFYRSELISLIEKHLKQEERPYWEAFLAGERPSEVAKRVGVDRKLASKKMKRLQAKILSIIYSRP